MERRTYDIAMTAGALMCAAGAALLHGAAVGLMVLGALVIGLTIVGVLLAGKS